MSESENEVQIDEYSKYVEYVATDVYNSQFVNIKIVEYCNKEEDFYEKLAHINNFREIDNNNLRKIFEV